MCIDVPLVESCLDVDQVQHQTCILIGTIFCDWKGKWNVLEELAGEVFLIVHGLIGVSWAW